MGKVSLVGAGMKSHPGVAAKTFTVLGDAGVNIEMISTSPIKISCVVREADVAARSASSCTRRSSWARTRSGARTRAAITGRWCRERVAVVGATGAVGSTMLGVMRERAFPADEVVAVRHRALGRAADRLRRRAARRARRCATSTIQGFDIALFSAGGGTSGEWAPRFAAAGRRRGRQLVALADARRRAARRAPR